MKSFETYRNQFSDFYAAVKEIHDKAERPHRGHGLDHDVTVAQMTQLLVEPGHFAEMAWCAAMLHSVDRTLLRDKRQFARAEHIIRVTLEKLPHKHFTPGEQFLIFEAAVRHGEKNQDDQSSLQQILMDADRLTNLQMLVIIRSGQFCADIPAVELEYIGMFNPKTQYDSPMNALDDLRHCLEWRDWFRVPKAKEMGNQLCDELARYIARCEETYHVLGLAGVKL
jgi:hypothetical protein